MKKSIALSVLAALAIALPAQAQEAKTVWTKTEMVKGCGIGVAAGIAGSELLVKKVGPISDKEVQIAIGAGAVLGCGLMTGLGYIVHHEASAPSDQELNAALLSEGKAVKRAPATDGPARVEEAQAASAQ